MKWAILNDVHIGARSDNLHIWAEQKKFFENEFFMYCFNNKIENLLILGDLFDRRKNVSFHVLREFTTAFLAKANWAFKKKICSVGNHDVYYRDTNHVNSCDLLLDETWEVSIHNPILLNPKVAVVPWITKANNKMFEELLLDPNVTTLLGHFEIKGIEMEAGLIAEHGLEQSLFKNFDRVISGHYHLRSETDNITYLGTQYQMSWADYGQEKGFHIFDDVTCSLEFIPNPSSLFLKVVYDEKSKAKAPDVAGKFVKLYLPETRDHKKAEKYIDALNAQNPADLQVIDEAILKIEVDVEVEEESTERSTLDWIGLSVDSLELDDVKKNKIKEIVQAAYNEVLE